jgi:hypothetical protein
MALVPGDLFLLPAAVRATIRNPGDEAATFLEIAQRTPGGASAQMSATESPIARPGIVAIELAGRMTTTLPAGPAALALGRAVLVPGDDLALSARGAVFVAIEAGRLRFVNTAGIIWSRHGADGSISTATAISHRTGDAILIQDGARGALHNAGDTPLVLLVVTFIPGVDH